VTPRILVSQALPAVAVLTAAALGLCAVRAQFPAQERDPAFEVASVKPGSGPLKIQSDPVRLTMNNLSVEVLIELAFGLREYQYHGPDWLHTTRYDIVATTSSPQPRSVQLAMLRTLLIDRFKLAIHRESKTLPVYALVAAKTGPKLKPLDANLPEPLGLYYDFIFAPATGGGTELHSTGSLGHLCDFLSRIAGRPVVDQTGIAGSFDIRLLCAIEGFPGEDTSPSVFEALPSQLGLKLEARNAPVEMLVVDHVEKPSGN
jgi:uncharacterized protein (TIGR03435 family)